MREHATIGERILRSAPGLDAVADTVAAHHERFDGTGYPHKLRGEEIPLGARIIHVADALDSMLTTRIYRAARSVDEALAEVQAKSGTQFCPRCVHALTRILPLETVVSDLPAVPPQQPTRPQLVKTA
jgi:HD-GYP domain-containing protein (c-di-GMP phosphodiesterase class II)